MPKLLLFPFYGPGYRARRPVVELRIDCAGDPADALPRPPATVLEELRAAGACDGDPGPDLEGLPASRDAALAELVARTALWLQRRCGHDVNFHAVSALNGERRWLALVEHVDPQVGVTAAQWAAGLALGIQNRLTPAAWQAFCRAATARAPGRETRALTAALQRRDIPFLRADREPLAEHFQVEGRTQPNGLLVAGQGIHHRVLDGSFCLDQANARQLALLHDPARRQAYLRDHGLSGAGPDAAARIRFRLLWLAGELSAVALTLEGGRHPIGTVDPGWRSLAEGLAVSLGVTLLGLDVTATALDRPPLRGDDSVLDFELAPDLSLFVGEDEDGETRLAAHADRLLAQLFPGESNGRIPVVAVTGTNGKTTTSRMVAHLLGTAGQQPALVCIDGIFVDGRAVSRGDASAFLGHARALASAGARSAALETHHRGIAVRGFAFDRCDVGVCLNVTPDHLAPGEIETLDEMVRIKRGLVEFASQGAVLNGQDAGCLGMLEAIDAPHVVLFASLPGHELPSNAPGKQITHCRVELRDDGEWIVLDAAEGRADVIAVHEMPSSLGGAARFMIENAMATIGCGHLLGIPVAVMRETLRDFRLSHASTPGRLNFYAGLPFELLVDYAHNLDGVKRLTECVNGMPVPGRRMLLLAAPGDRTDEAVRDLARAAAGGFDHYLCRSYPRLRGRASAMEIPDLLAGALLEAGVPEHAVERSADATAAIDQLLVSARPGDLVVLQLSQPEFTDVHERLSRLQARFISNDADQVKT